MIPVQVSVGGSPLRTVGWLSDPAHLPDLLTQVAQELCAIQEERDDAAPVTALELEGKGDQGV